MFEKSLKFDQVQRVLRKLGFRHGTASRQDAHSPVDQIVFIHDRTDTLFVFPSTTVAVDPARVESIRRILVGRGVAAEELINEMLENGERTTVA
jgi:hypothetical protein